MSIYRVADKAGVSVATVSRVINNKNNVLPDTRLKVIAAIESLGYHSDELGNQNKGRHRRTVLMSFPTMRNLLYDDMMRGASDCAETFDADLLTCCFNLDPEKERSFFHMAKEKMINGIILVSSKLSAEGINNLAASIPIVQCSDYRENTATPVVSINDERSAYDAVTYLLSGGLRKIGMISAIDAQTSSLDREKGYAKALRDAGAQVNETYIMHTSYDIRECAEPISEFIARNPELEGVFCISDVMAYNAVLSAKRLGRRVPEDFSVFGHDNVFLSEICEPGITTVNQESYKIGYYATKALFEQSNMEHHLRNNFKTYIEHSLIIRGSTINSKKEL